MYDSLRTPAARCKHGHGGHFPHHLSYLFVVIQITSTQKTCTTSIIPDDDSDYSKPESVRNRAMNPHADQYARPPDDDEPSTFYRCSPGIGRWAVQRRRITPTNSRSRPEYVGVAHSRNEASSDGDRQWARGFRADPSASGLPAHRR